VVTIVDGMNVVGTNPDGWWRNRSRARSALVAAIARWCADSDIDVHTVTVVFDGRPTDAEVADAGVHGIEIVHAPDGPNAADDVIVRLVDEIGRPGAVVVVTSDRVLAGRVRRAGAQVEGSKRFRTRLGLPDRQ